jgi:hypothetical protein
MICFRPLQDIQHRDLGDRAPSWRTKGSEGSENSKMVISLDKEQKDDSAEARTQDRLCVRQK